MSSRGSRGAQPNLRLVLTITEDWDGEKRRIDAHMLRAHLDGELDAFTYFIAGPPPMVKAISGVLDKASLPEAQVRPERFSGY